METNNNIQRGTTGDKLSLNTGVNARIWLFISFLIHVTTIKTCCCCVHVHGACRLDVISNKEDSHLQPSRRPQLLAATVEPTASKRYYNEHLKSTSASGRREKHSSQGNN